MLIMVRQKMTILLIGLICFSSLNGFFTVMCYGADGQITLEPVAHNHCQCPETDSVAPSLISSADHDHCQDSIAVSHLIVPLKNTIRLTINKAITPAFIQNSDSLLDMSIVGRAVVQDDRLSAFHIPLRTIILLA
jgi:hypothetical protein